MADTSHTHDRAGFFLGDIGILFFRQFRIGEPSEAVLSRNQPEPSSVVEITVNRAHIIDNPDGSSGSVFYRTRIISHLQYRDSCPGRVP